MTFRNCLFRNCFLVLCLSGLLFPADISAQRNRRDIRSDSGSLARHSQPPHVLSADQRATARLNAFERFQADNPAARYYGSQFYQPENAADEAGGMTAVYGTVLASGATPEASAWSHVEDISGMLGDEIGELVPAAGANGELLQGVRYNQAAGKHTFYTLRFNQTLNGIPVFRSGVGFLVRNQPGNPLVMSGITVKDLTGVTIAVDEHDRPAVSRRMLQNATRLMDEQPVLRSVLDQGEAAARPAVVTTEEKYVVFAGVDGRYAEPELAVSFIAERGDVTMLPDYHKYLIVASVATGEILLSETRVCNCGACKVDVQGTVEGRATDGLATLECDPEVSVPLPYAEVRIDGGNAVFADANGQFSIPHSGTDPVTVRSPLRGQFFEVFDQGNGGATPQVTTTITPPGPAGLVHNPASSTGEFSTSNVNAYVEANRVRDYVLSYEPDFPVIDNQTSFNINTNINSTCNATYNGSSINFYRAGGGCNNTSFSDVVYHEYGHHLINVTGNGQGQMGEGSGDSMGVLMQDDPTLGQGFQRNCNAGIRSANNNLQYPCSGGIHFCGQLISGCVWSLRNELVQTEPAAYRDIGASLFINMLVVRGVMSPGQSTIAPDITVIYLELDDDDTDIGNGTPHYNEIAAAFGSHNMDAPPLNLFQFDYPEGRPELIPHTGGFAFPVEVLPLFANPASGTGVLHVDTGDGSGFQEYPMPEISPHVYAASFPPADCASVIRYYVSAETVSGETGTSPIQAPGESFSALVASSAEVVFVDDFESNNGWTVSGNATDGQWERGTPNGGGVRGDPASDGDESGQCYVTDNVAGNSDVDGGVTILTSPVLDATAAAGEIAVITYYRWYSNDFGNDPEADIFEVEISNNNGATWVDLETVGPTGVEVRGGWFEKSFPIGDFVTPTSQMRVRFIASDLSNGSVVEAGVDGVQIRLVTCENPVPPQGRKLLDGVATAGQFSDVFASDDTGYGLDPSPTSNPFKQRVDMLLLSESPTLTPAVFSFRLEAAMSGGPAGDVIQKIELWNDDGEAWELVDTRPVSNSDTSIQVTPAGDPNRFTHPVTGEILARISWSSATFAGSPFTWSIAIDEATWLIE